MRIGVISDTHLISPSEELKDALEYYFKDVAMVFHAGDVVEACVLDLFRDRELHVVAGNMDSWELKQRNPVKRVIQVGRFKIGLIHGWGSPQGIEGRIIKEFDNIDLLVYGHTHHATSFTKGGVQFFNPGSPSDKLFADKKTLGLLDVANTISTHIITL